MDFGEILTRAWKITWKYKVLWVFGVLASCGRSGGGAGGGGNSGFQYAGEDINVPPEVRAFFRDIVRFFTELEPQQLIVFFAILAAGILIFWLIARAFGTIGQVGIIQGISKVEGGAERPAFGDLFESGKPFFWRVYGLNVLVGIAALITVLLLLYILYAGTVAGFGLCVLPLICVITPLAWLINIVVRQAYIAIVLEDTNMVEGLKRGWDVFRAHVGNLIVVSVVLGVIGAVIGIIFSIPLFLVTLPVALGARLGGFLESGLASFSGLAVAGLCFAGYIPILILLDGVLRTYLESAWTLTFLQLTKPSTEGDPDLMPADHNQEVSLGETSI